MELLRHGCVPGPVIGVLWVFVAAVTVSVRMSFETGQAFRPSMLYALVVGLPLQVACLGNRTVWPMLPSAASVLPGRWCWGSGRAERGCRALGQAGGGRPAGGCRGLAAVAHCLEEVETSVMTSLQNQSQLIQNPLDFSLDLSQGWGCFAAKPSCSRISTLAPAC